MDEKTKEYLKEFEDLTKKYPSRAPYSIDMGEENAKIRIFICAASHGNEVGSIPAVLKAIKNIETGLWKLNIRVTFALGNVEAIKINQRYVEEDMNRAYDRKTSNTVDEKRVKEIEKLVLDSDLFIDLHQTIGPTDSTFYVVRDHEKTLQICRAFALSEYAILVDDAKTEGKNNLTGAAFGVRNGIPSFTLELSEKGYRSDAEDLALNAIKTAIDFMNEFESFSLEEEASKQKALKILTIDYSHTFTNPFMKLKEGINNVSFHKKGDVLGEDGEEKILAPFDGYIFFPKYPKRDSEGKALGTLPANIFVFGRAN